MLSEILEQRVAPRRGRRNPRGVKRKMSGYTLRPRNGPSLPPIDYASKIKIAK